MKKAGFDVRIVSYEHIHNIALKDEKALVRATNPKPNEKILDAFCGYGAAGKNCLIEEPKIDLYLCDESGVQLKRAKENLSKIPQNHFSGCSFPRSPFKSEFFDKVVIKMGLHEVPKEEQLKVAKEVYRILKPRGKLVIWDIMLNRANQALFQRALRKKDELAGFEMLVKERYFFREDEFLENMKRAGFSKIKEFYVMSYRFSSRKRLEQELHNDRKLLNKLNGYIRKVFPEKLKKSMKYEDSGDNIQFNVIKKIYVMAK